MQKIVFTLCSNNYLAQAKTLGDSLLKFNPDVDFVIGLVDKLHAEIDYRFFDPYEILPYDKIEGSLFSEMLSQYNVIEFNTAVKPFYFEFLFNRYGPGTLVYYLDPDIACYGSFEELNNLLVQNTYLITPHLTQPFEKVSGFETMILNTGIYNLGFIGIRHSDDSMRFLRWWQARLKTLCLIDYQRGLFVDQIWINFITVLFDGAFVLKSPGYNMACWNFHERKLLESDGVYTVNDQNTPLIFFHFSGFKPTDMKYICKFKSPEFTLDARPDLSGIFHRYAQALNENNYATLSKLKLQLKFGNKKYTRKQKIGRALKFRFNKLVKKYFDI